MGRSKSSITVELALRSFMSSQPDTSTEGSGVLSLTREPGQKATVLVHKDLAVGTPGIHEQILLYTNGMTGGQTNDLMRSNPGRAQLVLSSWGVIM